MVHSLALMETVLLKALRWVQVMASKEIMVLQA